MKRPLFLSIAAGLVLSTVAIQNADAAPGWAKKGDNLEKCGGISKKGSNDCGANGHGCGGNAATDNDPKEWVYVPAGVCEKLTGGVVVGKKTI